MKKTIAILLAICLIFTMTACSKNDGGKSGKLDGGSSGASAENDNKKVPEDVGIWVLDTFSEGGETHSADELAEFGLTSYIQIKDDGTAIANFGDGEEAVKWKPGEFYSDDKDVGSINYQIENGKLVMDMDGDIMTFVRSDKLPAPADPAAAPKGDDTTNIDEPETEPETNPAPDTALTPQQAYWNGDWYGYWIVVNAGGDLFDGWDNGSYWFDAGARIQIDETGNGTLILWDEETSEEDPMCELEVAISDGGYTQGRLKSVSGHFLDQEIGNADWLIDPESPAGKENMILIEGTYRDAEDWFSSIDFEIYLRPWGTDWSDQPDDVPYFYDSWYLPLIQAGEPMPGSIGGEAGTETNASDPETAAPAGSSDGYAFTGATDVLDFKGNGEIFITYNSDLFTYDEMWEKFENADASLTVAILHQWDASSVDGRLERMENFSDSDGYSYEELTVGDWQAYRMTYIDSDFGDYVTETMVVFGEGYQKAAVTMIASSANSFEESQCSDVEAMIYTVTAK